MYVNINVILTKTRTEKFNIIGNTFNISRFIKWFYEYEGSLS